LFVGQVFEEGGGVEERAGGFDVGVHVGEHELNGLKFGDGFAEGFAGLGVFDGFVEGTLGEADGLSGNADASSIEGGESDFQALAFFAETIFGGDDAVIENDFDGGRAALAHFVFVATDFEAGEGGFDEEGGDSLPGCGGIGFGEDDVEAGGGAVGDPGFGAVEDVVVSGEWRVARERVRRKPTLRNRGWGTRRRRRKSGPTLCRRRKG